MEGGGAERQQGALQWGGGGGLKGSRGALQWGGGGGLKCSRGALQWGGGGRHWLESGVRPLTYCNSHMCSQSDAARRQVNI